MRQMTLNDPFCGAFTVSAKLLNDILIEHNPHFRLCADKAGADFHSRTVRQKMNLLLELVNAEQAEHEARDKAH
jgi:hypothetical protein